MALTLDDSEAILADIRILRRIRNEPLFRQADREAVIVMRVDLRIGDIARPPLQTVLTHHYGPALVRLNILGHQQNPIGKNSLPDVQNHLITAVLGLVID